MASATSKTTNRRPKPSTPLPLNHSTNRTNGQVIAESCVPISGTVPSTEQSLYPDLARSSSSTPQMHQPAFTEREHLIIIAGIIVTIQAQLLTSSSVATTCIPRAILSFCMILELLGALSAIFLLRPSQDSGSLLARNCVVLRLPAVLILIGIVGLAVVLVMEAFKT